MWDAEVLVWGLLGVALIIAFVPWALRAHNLHPLVDLRLTCARGVLGVNVVGTFLVSQAALPLLSRAAELAEAGVPVGVATLWRFFAQRRITLKKVGARGRAAARRGPRPARGRPA